MSKTLTPQEGTTQKNPSNQEERQRARAFQKDLNKNFAILPDGTVVTIRDYRANPETPQRQLS